MKSVEHELSIVVPVYNAEQYLEETINTILAQDMPSFELILVDDASNQQTKNLLAKISSLDSRVLVHTNTDNIGVCASRNIGISIATGKYILFIDADDTLSKFAVSDLLRAMEETPAVLGFLKVIRINALGYVMHDFTDSFNSDKIDYTVIEDPMVPLMTTNIIGCGSGFIIRNNSQMLFDTNMRHESNEICSDWEFYINAATKGMFTRVDSSFVGYRLHAESMSRATSEPLESFKYVLNKYEQAYKKRKLNLKDHCSEMAGIRFAILFRKRHFQYILNNAKYFGFRSITKMISIIARVASSKFATTIKQWNPFSKHVEHKIHYSNILEEKATAARKYTTTQNTIF